ncbi:GntR family transcriptional regulator [Algihabitans albus]|uniref:GntR family transcriptional regulator n=1 Tax=Algihabitans albus TaxID=2164067 RepID=UPI001ABC5AB3|nr:GntR family transcriptional regulator [Algihabitans albus]
MSRKRRGPSAPTDAVAPDRLAPDAFGPQRLEPDRIGTDPRAPLPETLLGYGVAPAATFEALESTDLVAQVTDRLARAICEGRLAPGQRLVEVALARQLGISRAPVREAARRLEQRGLLVAHPRRGFFVRDFSLEEIDDLYGLRIALERYAAELACHRATESDLDRLRAQLDLLHRLAEAGALADLVEEDLRFHLLFCEVSGNRKLFKLFHDIAGEIRMVIVLIGQVYDDPQRIAETHRPLIEALAARDAARLDAAVDHHIRDGWRHVRRFFAERGAPHTRAGSSAATGSPTGSNAPTEEGGI